MTTTLVRKIIFVLSLVLILVYIRTHLESYNLNREPVLLDYVDLQEPSPKVEGESRILSTTKSITDGNVDSGWVCKLGPGVLCNVEVRVLSSGKISYFEIFFSIGHAKKISIELQSQSDGKWENLATVENNFSPTIKIPIPLSKNNNIQSFKFSYNNPSSTSDQIGIGEVRAFRQSKQNIFTDLLKKIFVVKREPLSYIYYSLIFIIITLLLGYGVAIKPYLDISPLEFSIIWMKGIAIVSSLGLFRLFTGSDSLVIIFMALLIIISVVQILITKISISKDLLPLIMLLVIYLSNLIFFFYYNGHQYSDLLGKLDMTYDNTAYYPTPYGVYETDFQLPYGVTKMWRYQIPISFPSVSSMMAGYKISDRTPLLSLFSLPFLILFGDRFFVFEIISIVISPAFIVGFWVAIRRLFDKKIATITSIFLVFNHWIFFASHFGQVRLLVLFFISLFIYYSHVLLTKQTSKAIMLSSITASLAFLAHPFAIVYIFPVAIYQYHIFNKNSVYNPVILILRIYLLPILIFAFWRIWSYMEPGNSLLISSMVSGTWEEASRVMHTVKPTRIGNLQNIIYSKIDNILGIFIANPRIGMTRSHGPLRTTLPPGIGFSMIPYIVLSLFSSQHPIKKY